MTADGFQRKTLNSLKLLIVWSRALLRNFEKMLKTYEILTINRFFFFDNGYASIYLHYFFLFVSKVLALTFICS